MDVRPGSIDDMAYRMQLLPFLLHLFGNRRARARTRVSSVQTPYSFSSLLPPPPPDLPPTFSFLAGRLTSGLSKFLDIHPLTHGVVPSQTNFTPSCFCLCTENTWFKRTFCKTFLHLCKTFLSSFTLCTHCLLHLLPTHSFQDLLLLLFYRRLCGVLRLFVQQVVLGHCPTGMTDRNIVIEIWLVEEGRTGWVLGCRQCACRHLPVLLSVLDLPSFFLVLWAGLWLAWLG